MNAMSNPKTDTQGARRILLPSFQLTQTCSPSSDGATGVSVPGRPDVNYSTQPVSQPNSFTNRPAEVGYNRMPLVLDKNGIPWDEANLFVLDRLMSTTAPAMATFRGLADDLAAYRQFLDAQAVDYLAFPRKKFLRPTYRYQAHIKQSIPVFADLIAAIDAAATAQATAANPDKDKLAAAKAAAEDYRQKWEAALARELSLVQELFELKQQLAKLTGGNVLPLRRPALPQA